MLKKKRLQKKKLTKKQIKEMQASVQTDMQDWTLNGGELNIGTSTFTGSTLDNDFDITYGQMDMGFDEDELKKKYPALQDAHEHYQNILDMCRTREKEENDE
tara:strand:+ start:183 stop:488 length:306 start_codon:yes stop_codon:yes gene_type:complete